MIKRALFLFSLFLITSLTAAAPTKAESLRKTSVDFREVAKKAIPAVVSIKVKGNEENFDSSDESEMFSEDFWERFFGIPKGYGRNGRGAKNSQQVVGQAS